MASSPIALMEAVTGPPCPLGLNEGLMHGAIERTAEFSSPPQTHKLTTTVVAEAGRWVVPTFYQRDFAFFVALLEIVKCTGCNKERKIPLICNNMICNPDCICSCYPVVQKLG